MHTVFTCKHQCYVSSIVLALRLFVDFMEMLTAQDLQGEFIGQMHGGKKCPLNGITSNDKVWIKGAMLGTWFMF